MNMPLISCIIPVFNGERFLRDAVDSILTQTYRPLDIIAVDDGSTDGTKAVLTSFGEQVRYVWQSNAGPATARNTGIRAAKGEFIAFLDSDDLWHADKLTRQMVRFHARPELDISLTHAQNFWMPELNEEEKHFTEHRRAQPVPGYTTIALLARRQMFDAIGVFDTMLKHGDYTDWFMRADEYGAVIEVLPDVLVYRRLHANNRTRAWAERSRDEYVRLVKKLLDRRRAHVKAASVEADPVAGVNADAAVLKQWPRRSRG